VITKPGTIEIKQVPIPEPGHGEILIKIHASGVCHSDLTIMEMPQLPKANLIPGHEGAGVVSKVGSGVSRVKVGDRVGLPFLHSSCGACEHCLSGWEQLCVSQTTTGMKKDGCYAEYAVANENYVVKIPDQLSFEQAAPILCAGITAYKGLIETEVKPGQWVAIVGASGGLGHLAIQYARYMGMKVVAVDIGQDKLDYCKKLGAHATLDPSIPKDDERIRKLTEGGVNGVLVLAPVLGAFQKATKYIRPRGIFVGVAVVYGPIELDVLDVILKRKTFKGSYLGSRYEMQQALRIAAEGGVKCDTTLKNMGDIHQIFKDMKEGLIKGRFVLNMAKL